LTLCDTGPLIAMIDAADHGHAACVVAMNRLPAEPLLTTWPCLTEAMYLLRRAGGMPAQDVLWDYIADNLLVLHIPIEGEWVRMRDLMRQYQDTPMDLADASLVVAAERLDLRRVFSLDNHFHAYRINGSQPFEVVP
jgi:uncharacterized protein